jgi:choline dehydrogenase-like flavoprotein
LIRDVDGLDSDSLSADICVVGAGAAGIALASELNGHGRRVVVLESGRRKFDRRTQDLYCSEVVGMPHEGVHDLRFRVFGGSTTRWAGQALPLSPLDFSRREWVAESGWPLSTEQLAPYYERASAFMGIHPFPAEDHADTWPDALSPHPAFDRALLRARYSQFSPTPNFADLRGAQLEASTDVEVLLGANVTELITDPGATAIDAIAARSLGGRRVEIRASQFVLCAGGLETARLLLASDRYCEGGIGNGHDLVGRFFQDHPGLDIGQISPRDEKQLRRTFRPGRQDGLKYFPLFSTSDDLQRRERLLNAYGSVQFGGEVPSILAAKTLMRAAGRSEFSGQARVEAPTALRTVLRDPIPPLRAGIRHFLLRQSAFDGAGRTPTLTVGGEQAPNPESRVYLSAERDELGLPRLALDWRVTELDLRTWRRLAEVSAAEFERLGLGTVDLDLDRLPEDPAEVTGLVDAGHHMGTTRMADDPRHGVVDSDCRVHGIANLFIASSSVFPTSGFSNPTYTIIALALRLADELRVPTEG